MIRRNWPNITHLRIDAESYELQKQKENKINNDSDSGDHGGISSTGIVRCGRAFGLRVD